MRLPGVGIVVLLVAIGGGIVLPGEPAAEGEPVEVIFDGSGEEIIDRMVATRVEIVLEELERVAALSDAAARSTRTPTAFEIPVGLLVAPVARPGSRAWSDGRIRREVAGVEVMHYIGNDTLVSAGYRGAAGSASRRPWVWVTLVPHGVATHGRLVVRSGLDVPGLTLLEVAAMDGERLYLRAGVVDPTTGALRGEEFLVAGAYRIIDLAPEDREG